jgi:UDPglucose 6-dehydrogenase
MLTDVDYAKDAYDCARDADALVIVTEWDMFRALDLPRIAGLMAKPLFFDMRNLYSSAEAEAAGFTHIAIGR